MSENSKPLVGIIMGSASDHDVAQKAVEVLKEFEVAYEVGIKSAHRTPDKMMEYAKSARKRGLKVIIAIAGGSAHLPGMTASDTSIPVLAVPVRRPERGHDDEARKSSIAMPPGIPLAVMPDNGADRAALFAIRILCNDNTELLSKYEASQQKMYDDVVAQDQEIQASGWDSFVSKL